MALGKTEFKRCEGALNVSTPYEFLVLPMMYLLWFNFIIGSNFMFLCFLGMAMYDNEFKTKENKN